MGDGANSENLIELTKQKQLKNVQFIPFQPRQRLPEVLASADISLVILKKEIGKGSLPSKTFSILASGRPVLVSVDEGSETWNLIEKADAGLCVPPENPVELANAILALKKDQDLCKSLGNNGRIWAEENHSPKSGAKQIEKLLAAAQTK